MLRLIVLGFCVNCLFIESSSLGGEVILEAIGGYDESFAARSLSSDLGRLHSSAELPAQIAEQRQMLIRSLEELQEAYCRAGMLDEAIQVRRQIRALRRHQEWGTPIPGLPSHELTLSPRETRGRNGEIVHAEVTGSVDGTVWGIGPYTDDSPLATAAVHAGVLAPGETRIVIYRVLPGRSSYESGTAHGVTTSSYSDYFGSYEILGSAVREDRLQELLASETEFVDVYVIGRDTGTVWGAGTYTDDSDLGTAAVHAGLLKVGEAGVIRVEGLPGQEEYQTSSAHGVTSYPYGSWERSLRLSRAIEEEVRK